MSSRVRLVNVTELPTALGTLRAYAFEDADGSEVVAVVRGQVWGGVDIAIGISENDGNTPPSTALGAFENVVVVHFTRPPAGLRDGDGVPVRRLAVARAVARRLGARSVRFVDETPLPRMGKR